MGDCPTFLGCFLGDESGQSSPSRFRRLIPCSPSAFINRRPSTFANGPTNVLFFPRIKCAGPQGTLPVLCYPIWLSLNGLLMVLPMRNVFPSKNFFHYLFCAFSSVTFPPLDSITAVFDPPTPPEFIFPGVCGVQPILLFDQLALYFYLPPFCSFLRRSSVPTHSGADPPLFLSLYA